MVRLLAIKSVQHKFKSSVRCETMISGFREGQAELRNGREELEHRYYILTIVIIYKLNKNDC